MGRLTSVHFISYLSLWIINQYFSHRSFKKTINKTNEIIKINIPTIIKADKAPVLPSSNVEANARGISATIPEKL